MGECVVPPPPRWMRYAIGPGLKAQKQMKGFFGVGNWHSIYITKSSNIAAPLMTSLQVKYQRVPGVDGRKGHFRVPRKQSSIQWTPQMESAFVHLKKALSAECEMYIPSPDSEYHIHVDACDHGVGGVLEQQTLKGSGSVALILAASLKARMGRDKKLAAPVSKRHKH